MEDAAKQGRGVDAAPDVFRIANDQLELKTLGAGFNYINGLWKALGVDEEGVGLAILAHAFS